jgi:hypothetical protein
MFSPWFSYRDFRLSEEATAEIDRAASLDNRVHEEVQGVEWTLIRKPEVGSQIAPDIYLFVNAKASSNAHMITVMYGYDDDRVDVIRIWIR